MAKKKTAIIPAEKEGISQKGILARHYGLGDEGDGDCSELDKGRKKNPIRCGNKQGHVGRCC